jgi:putative endonuclease
VPSAWLGKGRGTGHRRYFIDVLASRSRTLYVGCTNDLARRVAQHRARVFEAFTSRHRVHRLVHFEMTTDARVAIARERELKGWTGERKMQLVESANPGWLDLVPP